MKKIFIAYADEHCAYSLKRITRQAQRLGIFDEVISFTPHDLPDYIKKSPLMQYSYGGGYWAWKPCVIKETLEKFGDDAIVCYVDAGCTLRAGIEWTLWFELMKDYDTLLFKYRDEYPEWKKFGSSSTQIKHWGKKRTLLFFDQLTGSSQWRENNKIWGGLIFVKGKDNPLINEWLDITLTQPEVIIDPSEEEMKDQYPYFARHKHDQVLLVALASKYKNSCLVLPETSETCGRTVAVFASRIRAKDLNAYIILKLKYWGRYVLGDHLFDIFKKLFLKILH